MALEELTCPLCGGPMVSRATKPNSQFMGAPRRFWGCAQFPKCRGTRNADGEAPRLPDEEPTDDDRSLSPSERQRHNDRNQRWRKS